MDIFWMICTIPALLFSIFTQYYLQTTFKKYSQISTKNSNNPTEIAKMIIINENLNIKIENIEGVLTDSYDSSSKTINISSSNMNNSIASTAVVLHELGHACQDRDNFLFLNFRNLMVPITNFGTQIGYLLIIIGFTTQLFGLVNIGILFFSLSFIFTIITLPVEFNASSRAMVILKKYSILNDEELEGAKKVLFAAALTYVAAVTSSFSQLTYLLLQSNRNNRD